MPLYEYECDACGGRFEVIQKFSETTDTCRRCGKGPVRRLMSSPAIQFKGTGWYITDYAQKGKSGESSSASDASAEKKTDSTKAEPATPSSKSDAAASSPSTPTSTTKD
jgi:putative FmdB family regulatory protein